MKFSYILSEGKKERIIEKFKSQLESLPDGALGSAEKIIDGDPSATKKYSEWAIKKFIESLTDPSLYENYSIDRVSDFFIKNIEKYNNIVDKLSPEKTEKIFEFSNLSGSLSSDSTEKKIKSKPKDINSFDKISDLHQFISRYNSYDVYVGNEKKAKSEVDRIYEDDRFLIVRPLSHKSSCYYGANTKWCTTSRDDSGYFDRYTKRGKLFYIIDKKSKDGKYGKMALLVPHGKGALEVYDQQDDIQNISFLLQRFEPIKDKIEELVNESDDYTTLLKIKENPKNSQYEAIRSEYFDRFDGTNLILNFNDSIEEYLSLFKDNVGSEALSYYNFMYQNPTRDFFYESSRFNDDMMEGYPLYSLTNEHTDYLKSIIEIVKPELLNSFEGSDIKEGEHAKIAKFLEDELPDVYNSFEEVYTMAQEESYHRGFMKYVEDEICNIYDDIGLVKVDNSPCFGQYSIPVDRLLYYYEEDLENNRNLPVEQILENQVLNNLELDGYPYDSIHEYQDEDVFIDNFDNDMLNSLKINLTSLESDEDVITNAKQYKRIVSFIEKRFGFNKPNKIGDDEDMKYITFNGVDPKTNKIDFTLTDSNNQTKVGKARLDTIIQLLNNYILFDPF